MIFEDILLSAKRTLQSHVTLLSKINNHVLIPFWLLCVYFHPGLLSAGKGISMKASILPFSPSLLLSSWPEYFLPSAAQITYLSCLHLPSISANYGIAATHCLVTVYTSATGLKFCPSKKGLVNWNQKKAQGNGTNANALFQGGTFTELRAFVLVVMMNCSDTHPDRRITEVLFPGVL